MLVEIALTTKSLYDLTANRITLSSRMRQYGLKTNLDWQEILKQYIHLEREYEKKLVELINQTKFAPMLKVKGLGARIAGGLIMHLIKSERIYSKTKTDKNGDPRYVGTKFLDELRSFNSFQSLIHFAGQHQRCKNCGYSQKDCKCGKLELVIAKERRGFPVDWSPTFRKWLLNIASSLYRSSASDAPYEIIYKQALQKSLQNPNHVNWDKKNPKNTHHKNHARRIMIRQLLKDFYNNFMRNEK